MPDVEQPPLLLELVLVLAGLAVRQVSLLEADDEHLRELEPLGGVERRERDRAARDGAASASVASATVSRYSATVAPSALRRSNSRAEESSSWMFSRRATSSRSSEPS